MRTVLLFALLMPVAPEMLAAQRARVEVTPVLGMAIIAGELPGHFTVRGESGLREYRAQRFGHSAIMGGHLGIRWGRLLGLEASSAITCPSSGRVPRPPYVPHSTISCLPLVSTSPSGSRGRWLRDGRR